ncbi:hypothetical protein SUGI_0547580 [Cryptomeria japonica]|nr:hypothetical protein SUGI_0547580 [Cryptomeria japonica]
MTQPEILHNQGAKGFVELQREGKDGAESWLFRVQKRFESRQYKMFQRTSNMSIYRVPESMRASKPQAYVPLVVSFGFYHHKGGQQLCVMDDHKLEAVERTLKRLNHMDIYMLTTEIEMLEERIRDCYEDSAVEYDRETVAWMFTMDACFILEFFRALSKEMSNEEQSFSLIFQRGDGNAISWAIERDIMKLENQIPLFVIIHLLQLELKTHEKAVSKLATILSHFQEFKGFPFSLEVWEHQIPWKIEEQIRKGASHLFDLCRMLISDFLTHSHPHSPSFAVSDSKNQNNNEKSSN